MTWRAVTSGALALEERKILVVGHDISAANPTKPPYTEPVRAGLGLYDVSDPRHPRQLGFLLTQPNGQTHGFDVDDHDVSACASDRTQPAVVSRLD